tara:strand:+ start:1677 stop:2747 length:1071 start_codon:yes stop_codon:yes gene_type:complete
MDLFSSTWMTRSLGESVSALHLESDGGVYAGGWNGCLKHWDAEGTLVWSASLPDRITVMAVSEDAIFATAGLHIVCLEANNGEQRWSHALEGSADTLTLFKQCVYAVSSVYDIEHNDFLESAVWNFSFDGTMNWVQRMDERPWVLLEHKSKLWLGLGRPKCGFSSIDEDGVLTHHPTDTDSPITCGASTDKAILFGHANGTISNIKGATLATEASSVEHLVATPSGHIAALENGDLICRTGTEEAWTSRGDAITIHQRAFVFKKTSTHWVGRWSGSQGSLEVRNIESGATLVSCQSSRCESMAANNQRIALGFENGDVCLWEQDMFERRMSKDEAEEKKDERKSALQEKLRALRDR